MNNRSKLIVTFCLIVAVFATYGVWQRIDTSDGTPEKSLEEDNLPNVVLAPAAARAEKAALMRAPDVTEEEDGDKSPVDFLTNSVFPDHPLDLYQRRIDEAERGVVEAQYDVYRAALECQYAVKEYSSLDKIRQTSEDKQFVAEMEFLYDRCAELQSLVGDTNELRKQWYAESIRSGHPITTGHYLTIYGKDLSAARNPTSVALSSGKYQAFEVAAIYVGRVQGQYAPYSVEPWLYLACERNPDCRIDAYESNIFLKKYAQHDLDDVISKSREIESKIKNGDYDNLLPYYYPSGSPSQ